MRSPVSISTVQDSAHVPHIAVIAGDGIGPDVAELAVVRAAGIEVPTTHVPVSAGLPSFQK
jgi:isocitrate/isopropylmalate dehydrogenase